MYILHAFNFLLFLAQVVLGEQPTPILPDPKLTPGDTFDVTAEDVCVPGYAKKVRAVPAWLKRQAYAEYGITQYKTGDYEVDHLIPLSLGGCAGKMMSFLSGALIAGPIGHRPDPIFADLSEIGVGFAEFERDLLRERVRAGIAPRPKNE